MKSLRTLSVLTALVIGTAVGACGGDGDSEIDGDPDPTTSTVAGAAIGDGTGTSESPAGGPVPGTDGAAQPDGQAGDSTGSPGATPGPSDRAVESDLRNAFTAARTISTDFQGRFSKDEADNPIDAESLSAQESSLRFGPSGSASTEVISVLVRDVSGKNSDIWLVETSTSGSFLCIHGDSAGKVTYGAAASEAAAVASCDTDSWPDA